MWALVGGWVKGIIVIVLIGNLAETLLPKGDLRRYAGLVIGLILLALMVGPMARLVSSLNGARAAPFAWVDQGPSLTGEILAEETSQAEAMVETLSGVQRCRIALADGVATVTVEAGAGVAPATVHAVARQAIAVTLGSGVRLGRLTIRPVGRTPTADGRREGEP